jgi:L-rhamnose mutarotase
VARYCFTGQVDPTVLDEYRAAHAAVWPEMLAALRDAGWGDYTLHLRDDGLLVGVVETPEGTTLEDAQAAVEGSPVNQRWQAEMARLFADAPGARPDRSFVVLPTVFDLQRQLASGQGGAARASG